MPKKTARRRGPRKTAKRNVRRKSKSARRKSKSKSKAKKVSKIIASSYGLAAMMKEDQKGYKGQRVAKKDPYKVESSASYGLGAMMKEDQKGYKAQRVAKKDPYKKKSSKKASSWVQHVKNVWNEGRKTNPEYKYKDAMKDAKKTW